MKAKFIEKELDVQNQATRFWFSVDGQEYAVVEGNSAPVIINSNGDEIYDRSLEAALKAALVVTDEMRAE